MANDAIRRNISFEKYYVNAEKYSSIMQLSYQRDSPIVLESLIALSNMKYNYRFMSIELKTYIEDNIYNYIIKKYFNEL